MKILHLIPSLDKGGSERLLLDICNELTKKGVKIKILIFDNRNSYINLSKGIEIEHCNVHIRKSITGKSDIQINDYECIVDEFQPDIIHSHSFYTDIISRENVRKSIIYFSHFHLFIPEFDNFKLFTIFSKKSLSTYIDRAFLFFRYKKYKNNYFVAVSKGSYDYYKRRLPRSLNSRICLLPNAINFRAFASESIRSVVSPPIKLITIGRLVNGKNHTFLLEVVKYLKTIGVLVHLKILGSGPLKLELEDKINLLELSEHVSLAGAVENVKEYLEAADIYVHSSEIETFGLSLLEAMANGLPCVALNAVGNKDIIVEGKNGFLVMEKDVEAFANKILSLYKDSSLYKRMSLNAIEFAKGYDIEDYILKLLQYYNDSLKRK